MAPQPLHALPPTALAGITGVLTDIDDTLTRDGAIEPAARAALDALHAAGLPVIAITGRPAGWSEPFALAWPVRAIVAENGGVLLRREGGTLVQEFSADAATRAARTTRLAACAADVLARVPGTTLARDSAGRLTDIAVDHSEFCHLAPAQVAQVVAVMREHGLHATVSSIHVNGWLGAHDKPSGARWAVQRCLDRPLAAGEWAYLGDSSNDQGMFALIPLSVGVANIARFLPELSVVPAWVTEGERGQGFAEFVQRLLAARP